MRKENQSEYGISKIITPFVGDIVETNAKQQRPLNTTIKSSQKVESAANKKKSYRIEKSNHIRDKTDNIWCIINLQ